MGQNSQEDCKITAICAQISHFKNGNLQHSPHFKRDCKRMHRFPTLQYQYKSTKHWSSTPEVPQGPHQRILQEEAEFTQSTARTAGFCEHPDDWRSRRNFPRRETTKEKESSFLRTNEGQRPGCCQSWQPARPSNSWSCQVVQNGLT